MTKLTIKQISTEMKKVSNWQKKAKTISRTFEFKDFNESIKFVNRVAKEAEKMNHHPDIDIRWNKVLLKLTTHDKGGLTEKDFSLAQRCDKIFSS